MKILKRGLILFLILILLLGVGSSFAADADDFNSTIELADNNIDQELIKEELSEDSPVLSQDSDEIVVENWDDIQYYSSLTDKNYILKLKENTNYYPTNVESTDSQVVFNNNVTIIGASGAYFGDTSPDARNITYLAMTVPDNNGVGITLKNITFKWIGTRYQPDGVFCQMGGNAVNYIENCYFTNISTNLGHSSILHIKLGDAIVTNCTFINCTTDFGCLSVYNPNDDPTKTCVLARMNVSDSYFEGNYARTEPGCINNCGILVVRNSTFYHNSAFWWAGAIHTHGGANTTLYDCNFTDNVAGWNGGALYTYSYLQIYNTIFIGNNCTTNNGGGAIGACKYLHAPYITIKDSLFKDNSNNCWGVDELSDGTGRGGAISIMDEGLLEVRNTTFIKNSASMGTAICAINGGLQMGSPDVILVGNRFINHTRVGDVLDIRLATSSYLEISDNYYYYNSFEFKKLRLLADEKVGDDVVIHIDAELKNPDSFESDILDTTPYDIYVDGVYNKTIIGRDFSLKLEDGETCHVYAVPSISDSVTNEILVGMPKEYVYVSQNSGSDENDGLNRTTPVKTMAKAIELARTKGNIIIMDGTFTESNLTIDYNLTITGEDNVKFSGNSPLKVQTIFTVTNADLNLKGITFDNIVFTADTTYKNKRVILHDSGYLTIENCTFNQISPSGNTAMALIEAKNIEVYNSKFTNNNMVGVYVILIKSDEFLVDNCTFTNNIASYSSANSLISTVNTKTGIKGTVSNSIFENNKVKHGCIYFGANSAPLTIFNTTFIANTVGGTSDHSSCIKIEESPTLRVDECVFKDNINLGTRAAVIYAAGGSASVFVSNSIIVNNSYANNNHAVFSASTANNMKCYKNLNGNWWGNTLENYTLAPAVYASACSNWIVLNMTANTTNLGYGQKALISIDLYNAIDRIGNSSFVDASKLPSFDLDVVANNGTASAYKINVVKGMATVEYTLKSYDSGSLTVSYAGVESTIDFTWSLVDPEIEISVENNTYGNPVDINITVPGDADASKFSLKINDDTYSFSDTIAIPKLNAGDYLINLTYSGDAKYNPYTITKSFKIEKATPQLEIDVEDIYYHDSAEITVNAGDATGEISIRVGDKTDSKQISSGKAEFIVTNLQVNNYTVEVYYSGDGNYLQGNASADFKVKKHNSTITISNSTVEIGIDVVLTFTVESDASGTIAVDINGEIENVTISGGTATYTIRNISKGLYNIVATYNGDAKYLSSQNATQLDVGRIIPDMDVTVSSIAYGQDAEFSITLNNDASGSVTVIVDGKNKTVHVNNGKASLNISDLNAGNSKVASIIYSGDNNYKPKEISKTFNVSKAHPAITIDASDIMEGQASNVQITITRGATGTIELVTPDGTENPNIPRTGLFTRTFEDLAVGQYTISVNYGGDSNYLSASLSTTFIVSAWDAPQWPNEGYDVKNTEKSPYSSDANGNIAWIKDIEGAIVGNMAIDSAGNVYITTSKGIYSINATDGSTNWIFISQDAGNDFAGIAISRDVILAPKSGDKIYFINQTTGEKYNNNIYQGSSVYAPIVDDEGNIYTSGEYYGFESTKLNIIPYKIWQTSTAPTSIEIGYYNITSSPLLVDDNTVFLTTSTGLMGIDLSSKSVIFTTSVVANSRPVVGPGNIIYLISNGHVLSYNVEGTKIMDVQITGTAGDYLSVGENGEIYSINQEGKLFDYSADEETFIYDFNESISSRLLVGQDGNLYVGSDSGMFYAIDADGNLLWNVYLNQSFTNSPVMDSNGVIYVISGNRIVAINHVALKDSNLTAEIKNVTYKENVKVDINITSQAIGVVSIKIGDIYTNQSAIGNGQISFIVSGLSSGNYTAEISYAGDGRFNPKQINVKFTVDKINPAIEISADDIRYGEDMIVRIALPNDATGEVTVNVDGKSQSVQLNRGNAIANITGLNAGNKSIEVSYGGDDKYNSISDSKSVVVSKITPTISIEAENIQYGEALNVKVQLSDKINGDVIISVGGINKTAKAIDGVASAEISGLAGGSHVLNVGYDGDSNHDAAATSKTISVSRIAPSINITASDISYGEELDITVNLNEDINGFVSLSVSGIQKAVPVKDGIATCTFSNLTAGNKIINVKYDGDVNYTPSQSSKNIDVSKIKAELIILVNDIEYGENLTVTVQINNQSTGNVTISVGDIYKTVPIFEGIATAIISGLNAGNYSVEVTYGGDSNFDNDSCKANVEVKAEILTVNIDVPSEVKSGESSTITLELPKDATGSVQVTLDGKVIDNLSVVNGTAKFTLDNLTSGNHTISMAYSGDGKYAPISKDATIICEAKAKKEAVIIVVDKFSRVANDYSAGERGNFFYAVLQDLDGNPLVNKTVQIAVNGPIYDVQTDELGRAGLQINLAAANTYTYALFFAGDSEYSATPLASSKLILTKKSTSMAASAKTFKATAKTKTVSVTLNTIKSARDGKTYLKAGKKITLKVGGKTYTAKINSKGVAKFNIKLTKKGKYTAKITFAGDKTYNACSKSIKITIK